MNKYVTLYAEVNGKSYFRDDDAGVASEQPLGFYSKKFSVKDMVFRTFQPGIKYDWHNAPQPQYIVYLEGEVEVEASGGEKRIFKQGDVLFATDINGEGHVTKTLTHGRSVVISADDERGQ